MIAPEKLASIASHLEELGKDPSSKMMLEALLEPKNTESSAVSRITISVLESRNGQTTLSLQKPAGEVMSFIPLRAVQNGREVFKNDVSSPTSGAVTINITHDTEAPVYVYLGNKGYEILAGYIQMPSGKDASETETGARFVDTRQLTITPEVAGVLGLLIAKLTKDEEENEAWQEKADQDAKQQPEIMQVNALRAENQLSQNRYADFLLRGILPGDFDLSDVSATSNGRHTTIRLVNTGITLTQADEALKGTSLTVVMSTPTIEGKHSLNLFSPKPMANLFKELGQKIVATPEVETLTTAAGISSLEGENQKNLQADLRQNADGVHLQIVPNDIMVFEIGKDIKITATTASGVKVDVSEKLLSLPGWLDRKHIHIIPNSGLGSVFTFNSTLLDGYQTLTAEVSNPKQPDEKEVYSLQLTDTINSGS